MTYRILADRTGFPLLEVPGLGAVHLFPVTKAQFECFMSWTNRHGDTWYDAILQLSPRVSYRHFNERNYEGLFMTGIQPQEALEFATWMGEGFDLPTLDEWRTFYWELRPLSVMPGLPAQGLSIPATLVWQGLRAIPTLGKPASFAFLEEGLLECVRGENAHVGVGHPRASFYRNAWYPPNDEIPIAERLYYFGFRLIKR